MKIYRVLNLVLPALMLNLAMCTGQDQQQAYSPEVREKISQVENNLAGFYRTGSGDTWSLEERMKHHKVNGISIAVISNYKIEWAKGYGFADVSEKRPVNEKTLFQAASISKSLNSVGVMKLVQDGRLDLRADVNQYLKTWKFPYDQVSGGKILTMTHLLSHTGGLTQHGFPGYEKGSELPTLVQILDGQSPANTKPVRSFIAPGERNVYSGGGTTISQQIVMDVTGQPYAEYMQKNILDPLGMKSSSYNQPPETAKKDLLATGYRADGKEVEGKYHIYPEQAAAGLWTNPTDLCKYIIETQLSFRGESSKVLSPEMTRQRVTPVMDDSGLGCFINSRVTGSHKYFNHNGGNAGFSCTSIGCLNDGYGVVVMTNSDNSAIIEEIVNSVAKVYNWKDYYLPAEKKVINPSPELLKIYQGKYHVGESQPAKIYEEKASLWIVTTPPAWKLYFTSDSDFFMRESPTSFRFRRAADGSVQGIVAGDRLLRKINE